MIKNIIIAVLLITLVSLLSLKHTCGFNASCTGFPLPFQITIGNDGPPFDSHTQFDSLAIFVDILATAVIFFALTKIEYKKYVFFLLGLLVVFVVMSFFPINTFNANKVIGWPFPFYMFFKVENPANGQYSDLNLTYLLYNGILWFAGSLLIGKIVTSLGIKIPLPQKKSMPNVN
jgi:hypothetical protein